MPFKPYYDLTKPGIVYGNALTATAGFFLATQGTFPVSVFFAMIIGLSLIIAAACIFNNFIDRDIDAKMHRTKSRAMVMGTIPPAHAITYGLALFTIGCASLMLFTNLLTFTVAIFGFIVYVFVYTFAKRSTVFSTDIGALAGAVPPVVGYVAVTNNLDAGAILLFLILFVWQMPHFFSIAIYREDDYRAAHIPVRSIVTGIYRTKLIITLYAATFIFAAITPTLIGLTGYVYATVLSIISLIWFGIALSGFKAGDGKRWARKMFLFSLIVLSIFSLMLILTGLLPLP